MPVKHGLYHHDGTWYHHLKEFPAALFDPNGYLCFETREMYLNDPKLAHGEHLHVDGGIHSMPGYVRVTATAVHETPPAAMGRRRTGRRAEPSFVSPEEIEVGKKYLEGDTRTIQVNVYERNRKARRQCIAHHGVACSVCAFEFEAMFGTIGVGFIHVHHLRDLASIGLEYEVDPKQDLRPICPNCHAMIHRRSPPFSVEELKALVSAKRENVRSSQSIEVQ